MKKKILIADDDAGIVDALKLLLEEIDYKVTTTSDGETISTIEKEQPDLVLLDVWMSGEDGREICKYIKNKESTKNIPIIMVSATRDLEETAKKAGAEDFITKPFQMEDLLEKVDKYTSNKN